MSQLPGGLRNLLGGGLGSTIATDLKLATILGLLGLEGTDLISAIENEKITSIADLPAFLMSQLEGAVQDTEQQLGKPLWELLVRAPAGLDASAIETGQAAQAVAMIQRMLGFGLALPLITARLETIVKGILGDHAPEGLLEAIRRLPEEIGVNFFIGTVLERVFETAVGTPLEEAIAEQTRPARFDWRVVKLLLTKHQITNAEALGYLRKIGYRDQDAQKVLQLGEQFLSVADLQALYLLGLKDAPFIQDYLSQLGYTPEDAAALMDVYLNKAETQGAQQLRTTARAGYLEGKLTEPEYRALLESVNTPKLSIDLEVESANLVISWGRRQLTVANVKTLHDQGHLNDRQALSQLVQLGLVEDDANALIQSWSVTRRASHAPLSVARILSYELGGVLTQSEAVTRLMDTGMKPEDASLLAANPGQLGGVYAHALTPAIVLSALKEGVIDVEGARTKLEALNVAPAAIDLQLQLAVARQVKGAKPKQAHRTITEPQVLEALRAGLVSSGWAATELGVLGYTDADAQLILAIEAFKQTGEIPPGWTTLS